MVGWFLVPYRRKELNGHPSRYCPMDDFSAQIQGEGGWWTEAECLGNFAIVKVRASASTLQQIAGTQDFRRLPKDRLNDSLSSLTTAQRNTLRALIESLGYTRAEWQAVLGTNLGNRTLRQVLTFILSKRRRPRYDAATDEIILDGEILPPPRSLESVDEEVSD